MKSKKIGMQALKIAIGSSLAIYIANLFGLKYSLAAGSVALLTMVTTKWKTVKLSLARVVTFIISVLMALIIFSAVESEWMAYGIYVFFVVIIAEMIGWGATISVNALIGMHFLEVRDFEVDFIANEFMLVLIGITMGLEDVISLGTADPKRPDVPRSDWAFTLDEGDVDPVLGIHYISEAYLAADPDYTGRFTVPALVDIPSGKVVNNDYFNLTLYFETAWKPYHKEGAPDLYPEDLREEIDKLNDIIFREVNNGVYKAGFARKQKAYDRAYNMVFNRLDWLEERLANQRYLFGDRLTESDVRLYVTLVRFDCAYYPVFRLNKKLLRDYPNLWAYARDLYQTPGFGDTTNFAAIKKHYHIDCCPSNEFAIVPNGPDETLWMTPHGREKLSGK